jgi:hypothetical protein
MTVYEMYLQRASFLALRFVAHPQLICRVAPTKYIRDYYGVIQTGPVPIKSNLVIETENA